MMAAAIASNFLHSHQMDVTTAFLNATLDEEVYMEMVEGVRESSGGDKVLRLWKSSYGLKQASRM